jgi:hypothetical protein
VSSVPNGTFLPMSSHVPIDLDPNGNESALIPMLFC